MVDVNLNALFRLTGSSRPRWSRRPGSVVNLASMLGLGDGDADLEASYCASKGAVANLIELRGQWARKGCGSTPSPRGGSPAR